MAVLLLPLLPIPPKFSKSSKADQHQRKMNADTQKDVFELIFAPLQDVAHAGIAIDCADGKVDSAFQFSPRGSQTIWKTWHYTG